MSLLIVESQGLNLREVKQHWTEKKPTKFANSSEAPFRCEPVITININQHSPVTLQAGVTDEAHVKLGCGKRDNRKSSWQMCSLCTVLYEMLRCPSCTYDKWVQVSHETIMASVGTHRTKPWRQLQQWLRNNYSLFSAGCAQALPKETRRWAVRHYVVLVSVCGLLWESQDCWPWPKLRFHFPEQWEALGSSWVGRDWCPDGRDASEFFRFGLCFLDHSLSGLSCSETSMLLSKHLWEWQFLRSRVHGSVETRSHRKMQPIELDRPLVLFHGRMHCISLERFPSHTCLCVCILCHFVNPRTAAKVWILPLTLARSRWLVRMQTSYNQLPGRDLGFNMF